MTSGYRPTVFSSGRLKRLLVLAVVIGLPVFAIWLFLFIGNGGITWRHAVRVTGATLYYPYELSLTVDSCRKNPDISLLHETDDQVLVKIVADSHPFLQGGLDCGDGVIVRLQQPLSDRVVVDKHTGQAVRIRQVEPSRSQPAPDWRAVEAPGWPGQPGFSLRLPPGWQLNELQGIDSYMGEIVGDGVRLFLDYGGSSWNLDPDDNPQHKYINAYRELRDWRLDQANGPAHTYMLAHHISGVFNATLLISMVPNKGYTGLYFPSLGGPNLSFVGEDLTYGQQEIAIAIFRSIRILEHEQAKADAPPLDIALPEINDPNSDRELQDLQGISNRYGIALQEAVNRYSWYNDFARTLERIRKLAPAALDGAEIVDADHARVDFAGQPTKPALDIIEIFKSNHLRVFCRSTY